MFLGVKLEVHRYTVMLQLQRFLSLLLCHHCFPVSPIMWAIRKSLCSFSAIWAVCPASGCIGLTWKLFISVCCAIFLRSLDSGAAWCFTTPICLTLLLKNNRIK